MNDAIKKEQKKLAEHMKCLSVEERKRQGYALMCWLQGFEAGIESAKQKQEAKDAK